jgi:hypothetical protein
MSTRQKFLIPLLIIPLWQLIGNIAHPSADEGAELLYLLIGLPICMLNLWEWGYPRAIDVILYGDNSETTP